MTEISSAAAPPISPPEAGAAPLVSFSTDSVPRAQRQDYWHSGVLRRLDTTPGRDAAAPFHARLTRLTVAGAELLDHAGGVQWARRSAARCRADQRDDISINFMTMSSYNQVTCGEARHVLRAGDMLILDSSQPTEIKRSRHRAISLFIPRAQVHAICPEPARMAGRLMCSSGMAGVLRSHLQATMDHATDMQPAQRVLAVEVAVEMALAALCDAASASSMAALDKGVYHAAKVYIARQCTDAGLNPLSVAMHLGCSRTGLYNAFAQHGESVAACIWSARVAYARRMLASKRHRHLHIGEIAFRSGFSDHSSFDRMFKRIYGIKPGDMRRTDLELGPAY